VQFTEIEHQLTEKITVLLKERQTLTALIDLLEASDLMLLELA
jgi:hypothetical protein